MPKERRKQYRTLSSVQADIRKIVKATLQDSPFELIDTSTGKIHSRDARESMFESSSVCKELISSMTTHISRSRIKRVVREYFQYVVLSHRWEDNEPLFREVVHITVYDLKDSPTHDKLQTYCKIAQNAGFRWAWSDTCCINKADEFVLRQSLVAMFRWYQGAALMIVFLRGVSSSSLPGALAGSDWNKRGWTLQEYIAAKNVQFYTEDWTPYRGLPLSKNHKGCPEVIEEMEKVTGVSAQQLMYLRPGLSNIREKFRLASTRTTTRIEDVAYSLLGIFSTIGVDAIYGEGTASLGRLLANVLNRSGDVDILAWTGESNQFNSCLPARITVYKEPATSHLPTPVPDARMKHINAALPPYSSSLDEALRLYDGLSKLPTPRVVDGRMTLSCIAFPLPEFTANRTRPGRVYDYHANTAVFGMLQVRTRHDLSQWKSRLYLVHPWLHALLEREDGTTEDDVPLSSPYPDISDDGSDDEDEDEETNNHNSNTLSISQRESSSRAAFTHFAPVDRTMRARRLVARLGQPFGALLLAPKVDSETRRMMGYQRVAADALITVQFGGNITLTDILKNVGTLDVL